MYIFSRDALRTSVEAATGGLVTVLYDAQRNPHYMRVIPKFTYQDVATLAGITGLDTALGTGTCTAFVVGGREISELFVGQYHCGAPGKDPDTAQELVTIPSVPAHPMSRATAKTAVGVLGRGWHILTVHEHAALLLWSLAHGTLPTPAVDGHLRFRETPNAENARPPVGSRHDRSTAGIAGLDRSELVDLIKIVDGRVVCAQNNSFAAPEATWTPQDVYLGMDPTPVLAASVANYGGSPDMDEKLTTDWKDIPPRSGYVSNLLARRLLLEPHAAGWQPNGWLGGDNRGTHYVYRGHPSGGLTSFFFDMGVIGSGLQNVRLAWAP